MRMQKSGVLLMVLGAAIAIIAWRFDPTVPAFYGARHSVIGDVADKHLMGHIAGFLFVGGAVLYSAAAIIRTLEKLLTRPAFGELPGTATAIPQAPEPMPREKPTGYRDANGDWVSGRLPPVEPERQEPHLSRPGP